MGLSDCLVLTRGCNPRLKLCDPRSNLYLTILKDMSSIFIFIFGLAVGSFLNVVICRLRTKEKILLSRSRCPQCGVVLKWYELIPVFSFLIQKGKCCYCHKKISWQYPLVEISTGLLFLLIVNKFGLGLPITYYLLLITCFLIIIFVYDLKHYIIPDRIVFPAIGIALVNLGVRLPLWESYSQIYSQIYNSFLSAILASGFFLSLVLISRGKWMGLGDVKLTFLMGLILGWPNILLALFLSFLSGAIIGIFLIVFGQKGLKSQIPFGPFLSGATLLVLLYGNLILDKVFVWFF